MCLLSSLDKNKFNYSVVNNNDKNNYKQLTIPDYETKFSTKKYFTSYFTVYMQSKYKL